MSTLKTRDILAVQREAMLPASWLEVLARCNWRLSTSGSLWRTTHAGFLELTVWRCAPANQQDFMRSPILGGSFLMQCRWQR